MIWEVSLTSAVRVLVLPGERVRNFEGYGALDGGSPLLHVGDFRVDRFHGFS